MRKIVSRSFVAVLLVLTFLAGRWWGRMELNRELTTVATKEESTETGPENPPHEGEDTVRDDVERAGESIDIMADEVPEEGSDEEPSDPVPVEGESVIAQQEKTEGEEPASEETGTALSELEAGNRPSGNEQTNTVEADATKILVNMSLEEKVAQLFFVELGALTSVSDTTVVGDITRSAYEQHPVGGFILMEYNITGDIGSLTTNLAALGRERVGVAPFIGVDEEGGRVSRLSALLGYPNVGSMADLGATGDSEQAYAAGTAIGAYLNETGCTVDFAPVADVLSNPDNSVIGNRSFGSDPALVAGMVARYVEGLRDNNILATLKHFPGHGSTSSDTHKGAAVSYISEEEWRKTDYVSFLSGIQAGAEFVMMGHVSYPVILEGDYTPASLSHHFITEVLREEMGFTGVVLTDALNMGAITSNYSSADAAVMALEAGCDIILMPYDFESAYRGVLEAIDTGTLSEARINESVMRILRLKLRQAANEENEYQTEPINLGME